MVPSKHLEFLPDKNQLTLKNRKENNVEAKYEDYRQEIKNRWNSRNKSRISKVMTKNPNWL